MEYIEVEVEDPTDELVLEWDEALPEKLAADIPDIPDRNPPLSSFWMNSWNYDSASEFPIKFYSIDEYAFDWTWFMLLCAGNVGASISGILLLGIIM